MRLIPGRFLKENDSCLFLSIFYFSCSFLLLQKRTKKGARQKITSLLPEAAMWCDCATVTSTPGILYQSEELRLIEVVSVIFSEKIMRHHF
jgi:hypothetical protein